MTAVLEARAVRKVFRSGDGSLLEVLNHVDLKVLRGEVVAVVGASGAGKSTLLHLLGILDEPSGGEIFLEGTPYSTLNEPGRCQLRNKAIGFAFQFHHLLREFTALENVMMPLLVGEVENGEARSRAEEMLANVGLAGRMTHRPPELSGGEQQRCAIARSLVHDPRLLLADEPTGNLDYGNSVEMGNLFFGLARELETSVILVTHNRSLAEQADRVLVLANGRLCPANSSEMVQ